MTNALLSQEAAVVADKGDTAVKVSQIAVVACVLEIVFAASAKNSQDAAIVAVKSDTSLTANLSQLPAIVLQDNSPNVANVSQIAIVVAGVEPPQRVALYPFTIGNFPTQPMYRK